jgi:hypothetical protein
MKRRDALLGSAIVAGSLPATHSPHPGKGSARHHSAEKEMGLEKHVPIITDSATPGRRALHDNRSKSGRPFPIPIHSNTKSNGFSCMPSMKAPNM